MTGISSMQSGLAGIYSGMQSLRKDAHTIASQPVEKTPDSKSLDDALVNMIPSQHQVEASAKTIKAHDEMLGTLLDEFA